MISEVLAGELSKHDTLVRKGRLSFADSFLHGRLGKALLKRLLDHACSGHEDEAGVWATSADFRQGDRAVVYLNGYRIQRGGTNRRHRSSSGRPVWQKCVQWLGFHLNEDDCKIFGCQTKQTIIYELELVAAVHALSH